MIDKIDNWNFGIWFTCVSIDKSGFHFVENHTLSQEILDLFICASRKLELFCSPSFLTETFFRTSGPKLPSWCKSIRERGLSFSLDATKVWIKTSTKLEQESGNWKRGTQTHHTLHRHTHKGEYRVWFTD